MMNGNIADNQLFKNTRQALRKVTNYLYSMNKIIETNSGMKLMQKNRISKQKHKAVYGIIQLKPNGMKVTNQ